jgi:ribonuclease P/MRP protein subunit POP1
MRLETAKMLQNAKRRAQKERPEHDLLATELREGSTSSKAKYVREAKSLGTPIKVRQPRIKNNRLKEPPIPIAKFRKRQLNKTWLPTHLYHSKRARMTPGKEPLWRFTIPLAPTEKCYRQTHRASTIRGTIAWDTSYISTIGLSGEEKSLIKLLKALGLGTVETDKTIWSQSGERWRRGTRAWHGMLFKRQSYPLQAFCPATVIWNPVGDDCGDNGNETAVVKQTKRKVMIRAHPSTFLQLWEEVLHLSKVQRPSVSVEDLRYDIGSIEIMGPSSTEALVEILRPLLENKEAQPSITNTGEIWNSLRFLQNPSMLPRDAVIAFEVSDPRLNLRSRIDQSSNQNHDELLEICTKWPFGISPRPISLFDRDRRQKATQLLKSQKSINRRKSALNRGEDPQALKDDLRIPVLLFTRQHSDGAQGIWSILLPWKIVSTVWYAIIHCPLSVGGTPRFGGLIQSRQTMYESGCPWFPADFPGTEAGMQWELQERAKAKAEWERKPKGRRKEFTSLDLGMGRKGEIGIGWGCDWQRLLSGQTASSSYLTACVM